MKWRNGSAGCREDLCVPTGIQKVRTVIIAVPDFSFAGINLFAFDRFGDRAELPGEPALAAEFLLRLFAHFFLWDKPCHRHPLLFSGMKGLYQFMPRFSTGAAACLCGTRQCFPDYYLYEALGLLL